MTLFYLSHSNRPNFISFFGFDNNLNDLAPRKPKNGEKNREKVVNREEELKNKAHTKRREGLQKLCQQRVLALVCQLESCTPDCNFQRQKFEELSAAEESQLT